MKNARTAACVLSLLLAGLPALTADRGRWRGEMPTELWNDDSCPIRLVDAGVLDKAETSKSSQIWEGLFLPPGQQSHNADATTVTYLAKWENRGNVPLIAIELKWIAFNSFDERLGERSLSFRGKKPLKPKRRDDFNQSAARISEDAARYEVSIVRLRFEDGTEWAPPDSKKAPKKDTHENETPPPRPPPAEDPGTGPP